MAVAVIERLLPARLVDRLQSIPDGKPCRLSLTHFLFLPFEGLMAGRYPWALT
jgi:hypothetical protein